MCSGAMLNARLKRVVFGAAEPKTGAAGSVINLFAQAQLNHQTGLLGGVLAGKSRALMKDFFLQRRTVQREASRQRHPLRDDALRTPDVAFEGLSAYQWQPHYVSDLHALGGLRMHYLDEQGSREDGSDSPLTYLCLHGHTGWGYEFCQMIPLLLKAGHRVIAPDYIGFGKSDKPKKDSFHTFSRHRQILLELVERLDLQNIALFVSARSGLLGLTLPMAAPERYLNLRIMNTSQAGIELPFSAGLLVWQKMCVQTPEVDELPGRTRDHFQMSAEEIVASDAPFPDRGHRAALRAFPAMTIDGGADERTAIFLEAYRFWLDRQAH